MKKIILSESGVDKVKSLMKEELGGEPLGLLGVAESIASKVGMEVDESVSSEEEAHIVDEGLDVTLSMNDGGVFIKECKMYFFGASSIEEMSSRYSKLMSIAEAIGGAY